MPKNIKIHTVYVRVLKWKALQVEIHPIKLSSTAACQLETTAWFQDRHMQEVLMLLKNVMQERTMLKSKDVDTLKPAKSEILTGSSVRLGYSFKQKEEHQICLLPADFSDKNNSADDDDTPRYRNLVLHSEKLVVYTYPLESSSQQNMLQLLSHRSQNQKMSISNYFQKTSSTTSSSQTGTELGSESSRLSQLNNGSTRSVNHQTTANKSSSSTATADPLSTSRKRTIKSIIKNSGPKLSNTKKRKTLKTEAKSCTKADESTQSKLYSKQIRSNENQSYRLKDKNLDTDKTEDKNSLQKPTKQQNQCFVRIKQCVVNKSDNCDNVQPGTSRTHREKIDPSVSEDSKIKTRFCMVKSPMGCDELSLQTSQQEKNPFSSVSAPLGFSDTRSAKSTNQIKTAVNDELSSDGPGCSELNNLLKEKRLCASDTDSTDSMFKSLSPEETMPADEYSDLCHISDKMCAPPQPSVSRITPKSSEISSECEKMVTLPVIKSKCLSVNMLNKIAKHKDKMPKSPKSVVNSVQNRKSPDSSSPFDDPSEFEISPKKSKKENKLRINVIQKNENVKGMQKTINMKITKRTSQNNKADETQLDTEVAANKISENLPEIFYKKRDRWRKRLTEIFPLPNESTNSTGTTTETRDCVYNEDTESDAQNETHEPFIWISQNETPLKDKLNVHRSDFQTSSHSSLAELTKHLKQTESVDDISKLQLEKLVFGYEPYLRTLFQGQISCWRHQEYKKGGNSRANLNHYVHFGLFTEEQQDVVMETLMSIFCKKHHKYLDYIMKVLLPEILIKILMEMKELSHSEADKLLATYHL